MTGGESVDKRMIDILLEQLELLGKWNKENITSEPEQARKNLETIFSIATYLANQNKKIIF